MFIYTLYTWLLANLLQFLMFIIFGIVTGSPAAALNPEDFIIELSFLTASLIISLPCLLAGWLFLYLIVCYPYSGTTKFLLWLITAAFLVFLEFLFILFISDFVEPGFLKFSIPAIAAVIIAILIRYRQFSKLIHAPKINEHEANLV